MSKLEEFRKRLIYQSWYRGTKETDLLLGPFARKHVPQMAEPQLKAYEAFLNEPDKDLYDWITGQQCAPDFIDPQILELIQSFWHKHAGENFEAEF